MHRGTEIRQANRGSRGDFAFKGRVVLVNPRLLEVKRHNVYRESTDGIARASRTAGYHASADRTDPVVAVGGPSFEGDRISIAIYTTSLGDALIERIRRDGIAN